MASLKVLITGPFNAGKTRFISSASDAPPVLTEEVTVGRERAIKPSTTIALDYGKTTLGDVHVYLFGTPGQERFSFMRELLAQGMDGYVVLADSVDLDALDQVQHVLATFATLSSVPHVVAASKTDVPGALDAEELRELLDLPAAVPLLPCDARERESVHAVLAALLAMPGMKVRR
ncbi:MAG: ATP/GTP-binding protein [Chloroflexota bacterium]